MAFDTPATIAIVGAGPIGIEAALYARFLGYDVNVYEKDDLGGHVRQWQDIRMFSPFSLNASSLGLAALQAQDEDYRAPDGAALLTGGEWLEQYLIPLAKTDLLDGHFHTKTKVVAIGRDVGLKSDPPGTEERVDSEFRLLVEQNGVERVERADIVIDASGVLSQPNWLGQGGVPAVGERGASIDRHVVCASNSEKYADQRVMVVGSGYSAATTIVELTTGDHQPKQVIWLTRRSVSAEGPMKRVADDRLPERDALALAANLAAEKVRLIDCCTVTQVQEAGGELLVDFERWPEAKDDGDEESSHESGQLTCDRIVANVGYRVDQEMTRELHIHQCYATEGPIKLAAQLMGSDSSDCLDQTSHGVQSLVNPEVHFYVLGAKSYGRNPNFLVSIGHQQIKEIFALIHDREGLDLYAPREAL